MSKAKKGDIWARRSDGARVEIIADDIHGSIGHKILFRRQANGWRGSADKSTFYRRYRLLGKAEALHTAALNRVADGETAQ